MTDLWRAAGRARLTRVVALAALAAGVAPDLRAQQSVAGYSLMSWTTKDGVFPGPFRAITQDADGYIWLGISSDLVRFDGVRFVTWNELSHEPLRNGGVVTSLCPARDGSLWIGYSPGGVTRLRQGVATEFGDKDGLPGGRVVAVLEDRDGTVWAGSRGGLARFAGGRWQTVGAAEGLQGNAAVHSLFRNRRGSLFVATSSGVFVLSMDGRRFDRVASRPGIVLGLSEDLNGTLWTTDSVDGFRPLAASRPAAASKSASAIVGGRLMHDHEGNLWLATQGQGLYRVGHDRTSIERITKADGLTSDVVLSLFEDRQSNIWVGTENGLVRLRETRGITTAGTAASGGHEVTSTRDGSVWIGTAEGLYQFSRGGRRLYRKEDGLPDNEITSLPIEPPGPLIVATARGFAQFRGGRFVPVDLPDGVDGRAADALTLDGAGALWFCDPERGLARVAGARVTWHDRIPGVGNRPCLSLFADSEERVFIGFKDGGVAVFEAGRFSTYSTIDGLPGGSVASIYRDRHGTVWISTTKGLAIFDGGRFVRFSQGGLPATGLSAAFDDDAGDLWFSFVSGIVRVGRDDIDRLLDDRSHRIKYDVYDGSDGMSGLPLFRGFPAAARAVDGRLWFVTTTGVSIIDPSLLRTARVPPPARVESVTVNGEQREPTPEIGLPPLTSELRIDYTALSFASPLKTRFRYRLYGFDRDWVEVGARRQAIYTNLPPGRYRFSVAANDGGRDWSLTGSDWTFFIRPRFYQTTWFLLLCASAAISAVWVTWRLRLRHVRMQFSLVSAERTRMAREIHDTLLQSLVGVALRFDVIAQKLDHSPQAAKEQLWRLRDDVQQHIREARQSIWDLRSPTLQSRDLIKALRETCDGVSAENGPRCSLLMSGTPRRAGILTEEQVLRIAREAVMNAVRHARATRITVNVRYSDSSIALNVCDDGLGFEVDNADAPTSGHWGLLDMRERVRQSGGRFAVESTPGHGTRVEATLPLAPDPPWRQAEHL